MYISASRATIVKLLFVIFLSCILASLFLLLMTILPHVIRAHRFGFGRERLVDSLLITITHRSQPAGEDSSLVKMSVLKTLRRVGLLNLIKGGLLRFGFVHN